MNKPGRPKKKRPTFVECGLRCTTDEKAILDEATEVEATRLGLTGSRNSFCLRAALAVARKELGRPEESSVAKEV